MGDNVHITKRPDGDWNVKKEGNERASAIAPTQKDAIKIGQNIAREEQSELVIHRPNGQIRDKDSYGNDPCPPKDKKH